MALDGVKLACGLALALLLMPAKWQGATAEDAPRGTGAPIRPGLPLPAFADCQSIAPPALPQRWRAVGLMLPFAREQIHVGEFLYDGTLPAMRATIYGLEQGTADLLVTREGTYLLSGPARAPSACTPLGRLWDPPAPQWLAENARCVGRAPLGSIAVEWWKAPGQETAANWVWYRSGTRLPYRTMMTLPSADPAVIGDHAMTYFTTFESAPRVSLSALRELCREAPAGASRATPDARDVTALLAAHRDTASESERRQRIASLIPGLSRQACSGLPPPRWPHKFAMTALMTPMSFAYGPFPSEIFYDFDRAHAQLTRMHDPDDPSSPAAMDGLLAGEAGYDIRRETSGRLTCEYAYPGVIKPDWLTGEHCECKAVIKGNPGFGAREAIEIRACPAQTTQAFWAMYTSKGRPLTFLSTAQDRSGLMLADYYHWAPNREIAAGILDVPEACIGAGTPPGWPSRQDRGALAHAFAACSSCHTTPKP